MSLEGRMTERRRRWRGALAGVVVGSLLGGGFALASHTPAAHTALLWYHGMTTEGNENAHPFLTSTDGAYRQASAAYQACPAYGGQHSTQAEYIHSHVHHFSDYYVASVEAHLGSQQTGMAHHVHYPC
jgi:hypothetical protein